MGQEVAISPASMNLGRIDNKPRKFWFEVKNNSNMTLDLATWASCGCTTPKVVPSRVEAGGIAKLHVEFDPTGKSGLQEKGVGVTYVIEGQQKNTGATFIAII